MYFPRDCVIYFIILTPQNSPKCYPSVRLPLPVATIAPVNLSHPLGKISFIVIGGRGYSHICAGVSDQFFPQSRQLWLLHNPNISAYLPSPNFSVSHFASLMVWRIYFILQSIANCSSFIVPAICSDKAETCFLYCCHVAKPMLSASSLADALSRESP